MHIMMYNIYIYIYICICVYIYACGCYVLCLCLCCTLCIYRTVDVRCDDEYYDPNNYHNKLLTDWPWWLSMLLGPLSSAVLTDTNIMTVVTVTTVMTLSVL